MSKRNRTAGHEYERKIKKELTKLISGSDWRTTREVSRLMDNNKIDLVDINDIGWFTVQCKKSINIPRIDENVFFYKGKPNILFWGKTQKKAKCVRLQREYVIMDKDMFYDLLRRIK